MHNSFELSEHKTPPRKAFKNSIKKNVKTRVHLAVLNAESYVNSS